MRRALSLSAAFVVGAACAPEAAPALAEVALPLALPVACDAPPGDLTAVLWQAGTRAPAPLEVDFAAGETRGEVAITTGAVRRLVVDWFVERPHAGESVRVLLAQYVAELDLTAPEDARVGLEIDPADIEVAACRDVRFDLGREGSETQPFAGVPRPVCDLDDSCEGVLDPACANLGEVCAGEDPLR